MSIKIIVPLFILKASVLLLISYEAPSSSTNFYTLTISIDPHEGGQVSVNPNKAEFDEGEVVTITATANSNWVFKGWGNGINIRSQNVVLTMHKDYNVLGTFEKRSYPLSITIEGEGRIEEEVLYSQKL